MDAEEAVLAAAQQIIDDEQAIDMLMDLFSLNHRQADLTLRQIRRNVATSARKAGVPVEDYVAALDAERRMAIYGFSAGVVCQRDYAEGLLPDGSRRPGPDYEI